MLAKVSPQQQPGGSSSLTDDLRVQVLRKMHASAFFGGSLDRGLSIKESESRLSKIFRRPRHSNVNSSGLSESNALKSTSSDSSKRSKSLSPLFPRRRARAHSTSATSSKSTSSKSKSNAVVMTSTESMVMAANNNSNSGGNNGNGGGRESSSGEGVTGPSTPTGNENNAQDTTTALALTTTGLLQQTNPGITVTTPGSSNRMGSHENVSRSGSGSETSPDSSDQQQVVFRRSGNGNSGTDQNSEDAAAAHSRSVSSENVSMPTDRRNSSHSRKSSPILTNNNSDHASSTTSSSVGHNSAPVLKASGGGNGSPKLLKRERELSSSGSHTGGGGGGGSAGTSPTLANATSTSHLPQGQTEKTQLQKAATHLKNLLAPNYKSRAEEFRKLFKPPENDKFVIDYSCAYQREILVQGRMYMSQNWLCFYANILFKWETTLIIRFKDITSITKEKTAKVIPNAIQVITKTGEKFFFTSFSMRDKAYMMMFKIWQNALLDQPMNPAELWGWAQHGYDEAEFDESDVEAEDALLSTFPDDPNDATRGHLDPDVQNLRRLAASAPLSSIPPLESLINNNGESIPGSEDDSARSPRSTDGNDQAINTATSAVGFFLHPKTLSKAARLGSGASSPGGATTATTPAEEYTESENDTEVNCPCKEHAGKEILNGVFPISVDQLFLLLFTDSVFFRKLHEDRKTTDLVLSDWHADRGSGTKSRQITYVVALNHSVGPKSCAVTEKQICTTVSKPGSLYVLKCETTNGGVPYSDTFSIGVQYCLSRVSANQCRIRVHAAVVYKKSCWGIVKSFIEKNALVGIQDFFSDLNTHLHAECARFGLTDAIEEVDTETSKRPSSRSRNRSGKNGQDDESEGLARSPTNRRRASSITYPLMPAEVEKIAKGILLVLILMLLLNAALFYKLWYFESEAERGGGVSFEHTLRDFEKILKTSDLSPTEWLRVFQQVRYAQRKQLAKWLEELDSAIKYVVDVEASLSEMKKQINIMQKDFGVDAAMSAKARASAAEQKKPEEPKEPKEPMEPVVSREL